MLRILLDVTLKRDLQAFMQGVDRSCAIFDLACKLKNFFCLHTNFSRVLLARVRGLHLKLKQVADDVFVIFVRSL